MGTELLPVLSNAALLIPVALALWFRRIELAGAYASSLILSTMYHTCLSYDVCFNSIENLAAADYIGASMPIIYAGLAGVHFTHRFNRAIMPAFVTALVLLYPRLWGNFWATAFVPANIFVLYAMRMFVARLDGAYKDRPLSAVILVLTIAGFVLLVLPTDLDSRGYHVLHSIWHVLVGLSGGLVVLLYNGVHPLAWVEPHGRPGQPRRKSDSAFTDL